MFLQLNDIKPYLNRWLNNQVQIFGRAKLFFSGYAAAGRLFFNTKILVLLSIFLFLLAHSLQAQLYSISKKTFFTDQYLIQIVLVSDFKQIARERLKNDSLQTIQPASVTFIFPDSSKLTGAVEIKQRGNFRREECPMGSVQINFNTGSATPFKKLGRLKLVWPCGFKAYPEQLVLKEFLVYKMYNLYTDKSFRVRLVKITCLDCKEEAAPVSFYAFFIEDTDDMARRNNCRELNNPRVMTEQTDRQQMTLVSMFEFMIGNTDWAVPTLHNIKLLRSEKDSSMLPYAVPYDFDYCGLVDADYAVPPPELSIAAVSERLYRGFTRDMVELKLTAQVFLDKRKATDSLIMNFDPLNKYNRKEMIQYLDGFYRTISSEKKMKAAFIDKARKL